jgi:CheY-like chemotaxis protein
MPGLDGWQLVAAAIQKPPMLRVIPIRGRDEAEDRERAAALRVPLIRKPRVLQRTLRLSLELSRIAREAHRRT